MANEAEYSLDSSARSYSPGLSVTPMAAYKFSLWGEEKSPLEGAIRTKISTELSPATYSGKAELEFSPVTFLSFSVGRKMMRSYSHFDDDACKNNKCVGSLNSTDASVKALFKVGPVMGSFKYTKAFYDSKDDKTQNFVEPATYILISPTNEVANQIEGIIGTPITETLFTGVLIQNVELEKHKGNQNGQYLLFMKTNGNASYIAGAGRFKSELKEAKPSLLFSFKYEWK
jgi:hypothetical protein